MFQVPVPDSNWVGEAIRRYRSWRTRYVNITLNDFLNLPFLEVFFKFPLLNFLQRVHLVAEGEEEEGEGKEEEEGDEAAEVRLL